MTAAPHHPTSVVADLPARAHQRRLDAVRELCDLAHDDPDHYSAELILTRGSALEVLIREALHTCHRPAMSGPLVRCPCGRPVGGEPDVARADHIWAVAAIAVGSTRALPLLEAAGAGTAVTPSAGIPDRPTPATSPADLDGLISRLQAPS